MDDLQRLVRGISFSPLPPFLFPSLRNPIGSHFPLPWFLSPTLLIYQSLCLQFSLLPYSWQPFPRKSGQIAKCRPICLANNLQSLARGPMFLLYPCPYTVFSSLPPGSPHIFPPTHQPILICSLQLCLLFITVIPCLSPHHEVKAVYIVFHFIFPTTLGRRLG